jgi:hypothetical protein
MLCPLCQGGGANKCLCAGFSTRPAPNLLEGQFFLRVRRPTPQRYTGKISTHKQTQQLPNPIPPINATQLQTTPKTHPQHPQHTPNHTPRTQAANAHPANPDLPASPTHTASQKPDPPTPATDPTKHNSPQPTAPTYTPPNAAPPRPPHPLLLCGLRLCRTLRGRWQGVFWGCRRRGAA